MTPVRLAVAGAGLAGKSHIAAIGRCEKTTLAAVADPAKAAGDFARQSGAPCYESLDELFARQKPDGVVLATPNNLHLPHALQCIAAGCPALVEKPIAASVDAGAQIARAAAAAAVPVLAGHHRRYNPLVRRAREIIAGGELGRLRAVHAVCWLYKPDAYFAEAPWRKQRGAGPVAVNLVHDLDLLRYFCGEVESAQAAAAAAERGYENEDAAAAILRFADGALATIAVADAVVAPWSWELTAGENPAYPRTGQSCYFFGGSKAALSLPDLTLWKNPGARGWHEPLNARAALQNNGAGEKETDPLTAQISHFADVIRGDAAPFVPAEEGVKTLRVIEAVRQAAKSGGIVSVAAE